MFRQNPNYDPENDPNLYEPIEGEDYIYSSLTKQLYCAWILGRDIEGYNTAWKTGEKKANTPFIKDLTKPIYFKKQEGVNPYDAKGFAYPILYLHRITLNLRDNEDRFGVWYGGDYDTITATSEMRDITKAPNIKADTSILVYNFVPHVLGTEGTDLYPKEGWVLSKQTNRPVYCFLNHSGAVSFPYTGLETSIFDPVTRRFVRINNRENLEKMMSRYYGPEHIGNIDLALDEYTFQRNASYDFMASIPSNAVNWVGLSWTAPKSSPYGSGEKYPVTYKEINHGAIVKERVSGYIDYSPGKIAPKGKMNQNFKNKGSALIRFQKRPDSVFFNYNLRTKPVIIEIEDKVVENGVVKTVKKKVLAFKPYYDPPSNDKDNLRITTKSSENEKYFGWYRSVGYGLYVDLMGSPYFAIDIKYGQLRSIYKTSKSNYRQLVSLVYEPWNPNNGSKFVFASRYSEKFFDYYRKTYGGKYLDNLTDDLEKEEWKNLLEYVAYYMKFNPDLIFALVENGKRNPELSKVIDYNKILMDIKKIKNNAKDKENFTYVDALMSTDYYIDMVYTFYKFFSLTVAPSEYTAGIAYYATKEDTYSSLNVPPFKNISDLFILNDETRTGLSYVDENNTIIVGKNIGEQSLGKKSGIEIYPYEEGSSTLNGWWRRTNPIPKDKLKLEPNKPYVLRAYLGYITEKTKSQELHQNGYGLSFHKDINLYMNVKYTQDKIDLNTKSNIDINNESKFGYYAVSVPLVDQTLKEDRHKSKENFDMDLGIKRYEPRYGIYEVVFKLTENGLMYLDSNGAWQNANTTINTNLFPDALLKINYNTLDLTQVKGYYFEVFLSPERNYYKGDKKSLIEASFIKSLSGLADSYKYFYTNDNQYSYNDKAGLFALSSDGANSFVAFGITNSTVSLGAEKYNNIVIDRKKEDGTYETIKPNSSYELKLKQGDQIKIKAYVKRSDMPMYPKEDPKLGTTNPVRIKDIRLKR